MRLWHYKLLKYLPDSQLKAQWRELNVIFKVGNEKINHILINYIKDYSKDDMYAYACLVLDEMRRRGFYVKFDNWNEYFRNQTATPAAELWEAEPFKHHHTARYLLQCFYNLQEKHDRGQKDFSDAQYEEMEDFVLNEVH